MLKIVAIVAVIIVALVAGLLAYAATKPGSLRVQRTASIKAAPEKIFTLINDFRSWGIWSPYEKKDPAMQRTLSGAASGQGAIYAWSGNGNVGQGRMEILESSPPSRIAIKLDFIKPFEGHNLAEFTFEPDGKVTRHLGDDRSDALHRQGHERVPRHGRHDRQGFRGRPGQPEGGDGAVAPAAFTAFHA